MTCPLCLQPITRSQWLQLRRRPDRTGVIRLVHAHRLRALGEHDLRLNPRGETT